MQNDSTTENANDAESPRAGAAPDVKHPIGAPETTELTAASPIAGAGVDEHSTGPLRCGARSNVERSAAGGCLYQIGHRPISSLRREAGAQSQVHRGACSHEQRRDDVLETAI